MVHSIISDIEKYFQLLLEMLNDFATISDPKEFYGLVEVSMHKGKIAGWEIKDKVILFYTSDFLDCDEKGLLKGDRYLVKDFSYHFNPSNSSTLASYRIDLHKEDLHLNPAPSLVEYYGDHISCEQLALDISNFNCVLAIQLALQYIKQGFYPADNSQVEGYNKVLDGLRRKLA